MKRILLSCTAAIAFAGVSAAQAAEPVKLEIGGYMNDWAGYASNKDGKDLAGNSAFGGGYAKYSTSSTQQASRFDVQDDIELNFKGSTKLDNGITVGVEMDTAPTQGVNTHNINGANKNSKRSFVTVGSAYGTIEAGEQDNVGALIHVSAPDVSGIGGQDGNWMNWVLTPTGHRGTQRTYAGDDRSDNKIIYITPAWNGLAAGFSYTPSINNAAAGHTAIPNSLGDATTANGSSVVGGDLYVYGLTYAHSFDQVSVKADVGSGQANIGGLTVYQGGLQVAYAGFTLGGSYLQRDVHNSSAIYKDALAQGYAWDAGLSYATGPYSVALNYFAERSAKGNGVNSYAQTNGTAGVVTTSTAYANDSDHMLALEGAYAMGPGVSVNLTAFTVKYNDAYNNAAEQNQGYGLVSGVAVKF